jgi:hypothetical protein
MVANENEKRTQRYLLSTAISLKMDNFNTPAASPIFSKGKGGY